MVKRAFDIFFSFTGIVILLPLFLIIALIIIAGSKGGALYRQKRTGKHRSEFNLLKFRTMYLQSDKSGVLTLGSTDPRITPFGRWLRKYKLDELPQLFNILKGDMSFVGPRPEVGKYVGMYTEKQLRTLTVRPGLTDLASLEYTNESDLLSTFDDPEKAYVEWIMPDKLEKNLQYIDQMSMLTDIRIIIRTVGKVFFSRH